MTSRKASCCCGQLKVETHGDPVRVSICHCHACQRRTGSVFGAQARFPADRVNISGESRQYRRTGDSGTGIVFHFCPQCGSTVHYQIEGHEDTVAIPVGAFADQAFPQPTFSVYEAFQHAWVELPPGVEHWD